MIAAENKAISRTVENRLHAAAVRFDACRLRIVQLAAMHRAPEVCVQLEIRTAPLVSHRVKQRFEMPLHFGMRAVQRVPRPAPPSLKRNLASRQRLTVGVLHEPIRIRLEQFRARFRDKWRYPYGRFEAALPNFFQHTLN